MRNKGIKLLVFNLVLSAVCIYLISPGFMGFNPAAHVTYKRGMFYVVILVAAILFFTVNYFILTPSKKVKLVDDSGLKSPKDYIKTLQDYAYKKEFSKQIAQLIGQIKRLSPKQASLDVILEQNFDKTEMTYIKFKTTIDEVIGLFYGNVKRAINRISVFDEEEYRKLQRNELSIPDDSKQLKIQIYSEHIAFVDGVIKQNEDIITLLDNLMLEISKLDEINGKSMENIQILAEMRELIKNTKYYG